MPKDAIIDFRHMKSWSKKYILMKYLLARSKEASLVTAAIFLVVRKMSEMWERDLKRKFGIALSARGQINFAEKRFIRYRRRMFVLKEVKKVLTIQRKLGSFTLATVPTTLDHCADLEPIVRKAVFRG